MRRRPPPDRNGLHQGGSDVPELLRLQDVPDPRTDHPEEPALRPVRLNQDIKIVRELQETPGRP